jgi:lantibiotic biosynthesis protein
MARSETTWKPILEGELRDRCRQAVMEIGDRLLEDASELLREASPTLPPNLSGGKAGHALFYFELGEFLDEPEMTAAGVALLDEAAELVASSPLSVGLFGGFTGVAWAREHLAAGRFAETTRDAEPADASEDGDEGADVDHILFDYIEPSPWRGAFDLVRGLTGYGIYALESLPRPSARELLERVVLRLDEISVADETGVAWYTPFPLVPLHRREQFPDGYYDLGVAHGTPGVLTLLASARLHGVAEERIGVLLEGAVDWLLAHRSSEPTHREFPPFLAPQALLDRGRAAWCYGAPGVAAALAAVAQALDRPDLLGEAVEIAHRSWTRPRETSQVRDAGLCHGAAGLGHIYNRLYQASGDERMAEASRSWFARSLELRVPGLRVAGFAALEPRPDGSGEVFWQEDGGLMSGAAGVGLAMLAALGDREPSWDRALGLSLLRPN